MYYVFNSLAHAEQAIVIINAALGYPDYGRKTVTWDVPRKRLDNKYIVSVPEQSTPTIPNATIEEYLDSWFGSGGN